MNVIWIIADQLRAQATGYAGDPNAHTPNLDRLSAEGYTFTHAVGGAPLCCPFRGAMVTGRYPHRSGVPAHESPMPADTRTLAHTFRDHGYRTCYVGKWHLDGARPELDPSEHRSPRTRLIPPHRRGGFEDWWAYENNNRPFDCLVHTDAGQTPEGIQVLREQEGMEQFRLPGYETDSLTDVLLGWLDRHVSGARGMRTEEGSYQPFFAVLSVQPPHNPYTAPEENMARYTPGQIQLRPNVPAIPAVMEQARRDLAGYYAAIERLDWNVGRLRAALDELGLADDTYLFFFSDHGDMHGSHGQWRKTNPWEESIRIPFIVGGPSREHQASARPDHPINHVDIAPTTLGLCGLTPPATMEGADYSPLIARPPHPGAPAAALPDSAYIGLPVPTGHGDSLDRPWRGLVTRDGWKYVCLERQPLLLFNLAEDPYELANHAHNPRLRAERHRLQDRLAQWIADTQDTFPLPAIA